MLQFKTLKLMPEAFIFYVRGPQLLLAVQPSLVERRKGRSFHLPSSGHTNHDFLPTFQLNTSDQRLPKFAQPDHKPSFEDTFMVPQASQGYEACEPGQQPQESGKKEDHSLSAGALEAQLDHGREISSKTLLNTKRPCEP
jgi:hypothetical protein